MEEKDEGRKKTGRRKKKKEKPLRGRRRRVAAMREAGWLLGGEPVEPSVDLVGLAEPRNTKIPAWGDRSLRDSSTFIAPNLENWEGSEYDRSKLSFLFGSPEEQQTYDRMKKIVAAVRAKKGKGGSSSEKESGSIAYSIQKSVEKEIARRERKRAAENHPEELPADAVIPETLSVEELAGAIAGDLGDRDMREITGIVDISGYRADLQTREEEKVEEVSEVSDEEILSDKEIDEMFATYESKMKKDSGSVAKKDIFGETSSIEELYPTQPDEPDSVAERIRNSVSPKPAQSPEPSKEEKEESDEMKKENGGREADLAKMPPLPKRDRAASAVAVTPERGLTNSSSKRPLTDSSKKSATTKESSKESSGKKNKAKAEHDSRAVILLFALLGIILGTTTFLFSRSHEEQQTNTTNAHDQAMEREPVVVVKPSAPLPSPLPTPAWLMVRQYPPTSETDCLPDGFFLTEEALPESVECCRFFEGDDPYNLDGFYGPSRVSCLREVFSSYTN